MKRSNHLSLHTLGLLALLSAGSLRLEASDLVLRQGESLPVYVSREAQPVVQTALRLFGQDYGQLLGGSLSVGSKNPKGARLVVGTLGDKSLTKFLQKHHIDLRDLQGLHEGYLLQLVDVGHQPVLFVLGSDKRGTAYGLMTLSRMMGMSPWSWWADVKPQPLQHYTVEDGFRAVDSPVVAFRGIFINDEDFAFHPWAKSHAEATERVFELMLRLRANLYWPPMHDISEPFYHNPANQQLADRYGILVSTSHCEPMMCNANGEWRQWAQDAKGKRYDYVHNRDSVLLFWEQRVRGLAQSGSECIYTLGMRGIHDGPMQGARSIDEQVTALNSILADQRALLSRHVNADVARVPQQFVPYKEMLDCYRRGLQLPDDVTLIWCDDNYGYLRHLPTEAERQRSGGNGVYYHASYWGRPHDYLWLSTTHPELIRSEMMRGYDHGIDRLWVLNVGDIKPAEFTTSFFLDMAWCPDDFRQPESVAAYCDAWYEEQTGIRAPWHELWSQYYDLSFSLRPEWMGGTRTEEKDPRWKRPADLPLSRTQILQRLQKVGRLEQHLSSLFGARGGVTGSQSAVYQLVEYPVLSLCAQNRKWLSAQLARHGGVSFDESRAAHRRIQSLTEQYNALEGGKWQGMMNASPRGLADFAPVPEEVCDSLMPVGQEGNLVYEAQFEGGVPDVVGRPLAEGESISFRVINSSDHLLLQVHTLPVHPLHEGRLRYSVSVDGGKPIEVDFHTEGRSEEWKQNVLYNRASRDVRLPLDGLRSRHEVVIRALDEGIRLQRVYMLTR